MPHQAPHNIYLDYWDIILMPEGEDEGLFDSDFAIGMGITVANFFLGLLKVLPDTPQGKFLALELSGRFITTICTTAIAEDNNDEGQA